MNRSRKVRVVTGDNAVFDIPIKVFKMWKRWAGKVSTSAPVYLPGAKGKILKFLIDWCEHHQNDGPVEGIDSPNFGITSIDDIPAWDKEFMSRMSISDISGAIEASAAADVKPFMVLVLKENFARNPMLLDFTFNAPPPIESFKIYNPSPAVPLEQALGLPTSHIPDTMTQSFFILCGDGSKHLAHVKVIKMWRTYAKDLKFVEGEKEMVYHTSTDTTWSIPEVSGPSMKFIIEWCEKHAKDEEAADFSDLPNLGITALDDVTDCPVISRLTRNEMKAALKDCTRLNLQPLIIILLKTMFKRYNLEKIVLKDVRNLNKKITVLNPTKSNVGSETNSLTDQCGNLHLERGEQ